MLLSPEAVSLPSAAPAGLPRISIVTPSFNQGKFLPETLESLLAQDYPSLEVIIQDGGSTDGSVEIAQDYARRHPAVFRVFVQKDRGHAHALNLGFAHTTGEILGFLNSDDTLYPGTLHRVAQEIDPARDRYVVFGRSLFTGEGSPYVGVEHPAEFKSHFEHLAIWKRGYNTIPQPSVFWHRTVWDRCGGLDENEGHAIDYDLFCRFSAQYDFHRVDELWSTYRMHPASKSAQKAEDEVLALSVKVSRRHWGGWWSPLRWRLAASHWLHDRHLHERARHHARRAEQRWAESRRLTAVGEFTRTLLLSPSIAWQRLLQPLLAARGLAFTERWAFRPAPPGENEFTGRHGDGWIGPVYREERAFPPDAGKLYVVLEHPGSGEGRPRETKLELRLDGQLVAQQKRSKAGQFSLDADAGALGLAGRTVPLELRISPFWVPRLLTGAPDDRRLTVTLLEIVVQTAEAAGGKSAR